MHRPFNSSSARSARRRFARTERGENFPDMLKYFLNIAHSISAEGLLQVSSSYRNFHFLTMLDAGWRKGQMWSSSLLACVHPEAPYRPLHRRGGVDPRPYGIIGNKHGFQMETCHHQASRIQHYHVRPKGANLTSSTTSCLSNPRRISTVSTFT